MERVPSHLMFKKSSLGENGELGMQTGGSVTRGGIAIMPYFSKIKKTKIKGS